jgi:outer membrane protein assembly factor BamB
MRRFLAWFYVLCLPTGVQADNWPQFRGPHGAGVSTEPKLPIVWGAEKNLAWKVEVPGLGWSSPIVWGERLFLTTAVPEGEVEKPDPRMQLQGESTSLRDVVYRWEIHCLNRKTGQRIWKEVAARHKPTIPIHLKNSYATETPVTDGERVYVYFGSAGLYCYDVAGKLRWKKDLGSHPMRNGWGTGSSPVLDGDRLFVLYDNEEKSFLTAFNKKTGEELWRVDRDEKSSWGTPFIWRSKERTELVTMARRVRSYDPATGNLFWELGGMAGTATTTPAAGADLLYLGAANMPFETEIPLYAISPGSSGDLTPTPGKPSAIAWAVAKGAPSMPSPLVYGDQVYVLHEQGYLHCLDAKTGQEVYPRQRLQRTRRGFSASPWAYDGKVFCLSQDGTTYVVKAGPEFKLLEKNSLEDMFLATPAIAEGALYLRGRDYLYCIRAAGAKTTRP